MTYILASVTVLLFGFCYTRGNEQYCPLQCECYNIFTIADCCCRNFTQLPHISTLTRRFYVTDNTLQEIPAGFFQNHSQLVQLTFQNNQLTGTLHACASFTGLESVQEINLAKNSIDCFKTTDDTELISNHSCQLNSLKVLNLSRNQLKLMPTALWGLAPALEILNLAYNELHSCRLDDSYGLLSHLHLLDLSGNPIHAIGSNDLAPLGLTPLATLRLSDLSATTIASTALVELVNLSSLSLAHNAIPVSLLEESFQSAVRANTTLALEDLDLSQMILPNVSSTLLEAFPGLLSLDLSSSGINWISSTALETVPHLTILNLRSNFLQQLPGVQSLASLRKLNLADNKLHDVNLTGLGELEIIDLSFNSLREVPARWISQKGLNSTDIIQLINVSYNDLTDISHSALWWVCVHTLDLSHNRLTSFTRLGLSSVDVLLLNHNQIRLITEDAFDNIDIHVSEMDLSRNDLTFLPSIHRRQFPSLHRLNLAHNRLGAALASGMMADWFQGVSQLLVLDLSANAITSFPESTLASLRHLATLNLADNYIKHLSGVGLPVPRSIAKLVLSNNDVSVVDASTLSAMKHLEVLDLSNNPFDCTCRAIEFQRWINTGLVSVHNVGHYQAYSCQTPDDLRGQPLLLVHPDTDPCEPHWHQKVSVFTIVVAAFSATTVLTALIGGAVYAWCGGDSCQRCQYQWKARYREVSAVNQADCHMDGTANEMSASAGEDWDTMAVVVGVDNEVYDEEKEGAVEN